MKRCLIIVAIFMVIALADAVNASAINVGSQSREVTVGEVDRIESDDENVIDEGQEVRAPETGLFGLETDQASIMIAAFLSIPVAVILAWLSIYIYHRYARQE